MNVEFWSSVAKEGEEITGPTFLTFQTSELIIICLGCKETVNFQRALIDSEIEGSNDEEDEQVDASIDSDDDLESISARGGGADSDSDDDSDEEASEAANAEDSDEDDSSIRTSPLLANADGGSGSGSARNTKIKTENLSSYATVKIENSDGTKDGGAQGTGPAGPTAPAGSSLLKKTPRRSSLRTFRPVELIAPEKKV